MKDPCRNCGHSAADHVLGSKPGEDECCEACVKCGCGVYDSPKDLDSLGEAPRGLVDDPGEGASSES